MFIRQYGPSMHISSHGTKPLVSNRALFLETGIATSSPRTLLPPSGFFSLAFCRVASRFAFFSFCSEIACMFHQTNDSVDYVSHNVRLSLSHCTSAALKVFTRSVGVSYPILLAHIPAGQEAKNHPNGSILFLQLHEAPTVRQCLALANLNVFRSIFVFSYNSCHSKIKLLHLFVCSSSGII